MRRDEILERYLRLRAISVRQQSAAFDCVAGSTILEHAKHLGLAFGRTIVADSEAELTLISDLAVHTAKPGRSRAIDRYARSAAPAPGSVEACVLDALRQARFSIWRIERHHETAGLVVDDLIRGEPAWLIDQGLTISGPPGTAYASRLCWPDEFAVTCGVIVPVDRDLLEDVLDGRDAWLRSADRSTAVEDPRFAAAIYRAALAAGIMDNVEYREPLIAS